MTLELAAALREKTCIAINNTAIDTVIAGILYPARVPWAVALCAQDHNWWRHNPLAMDFPGRKFSSNRIHGVEQVVSQWVPKQAASSVLAMEAAWRMHPQRVELWGFDHDHGHYFGEHPHPLNRTPPGRFDIFERQLAEIGREMKRDGIEIVNCTSGSKLRCFPCP